MSIRRASTSDQLSEDRGRDEEETPSQRSRHTGPTTSPTTIRRMHSTRMSDLDLRSRRPTRQSYADERSSLLEYADGMEQSYTSLHRSPSMTPRVRASRRPSITDGVYLSKSHNRSALFSQRLVSALSSNRNVNYQNGSLEDSKTSFSDHRVWYDQVWPDFTQVVRHG